MRGRIALALLVLGADSAFARDRPVVTDWREIVTGDDRARLRNWREAWIAALAAVRGGDGGTIDRDPALFQPDGALPYAAPPAGGYRCRVFKLGKRGGASGLAFVTYPAFACRIDADPAGLRLTKLTGSQRPIGIVYPDGAARAVFLGTLVLGDERQPRRYGSDVNRGMAGIVTRIGERRWRLALPEPKFESKLDLIELVPTG